MPLKTGIFLGGHLVSAPRSAPQGVCVCVTFFMSGPRICPGSPPRVAAISIRPRHSSPSVNRQFAELAAMGVEDLQVEGPTIDSRNQGLSIGKTNDHSV